MTRVPLQRPERDALVERSPRVARALLRGLTTACALTTTAERFCLARGWPPPPPG